MLRIDKQVWYISDDVQDVNAVIGLLKSLNIKYEVETKVSDYDFVSDTWEQKTQISFSCSDTDYATISDFVENL